MAGFGKKKSAAHESGMRGYEKPTMEGEEANGIRDEEEHGENESSEEQDDLGKLVAQHIHGPDEEGHHHLNLTTLADDLKKSGGLHDK